MRKTGSNNGKDGTFGAPKPLPGQAGYKATDTDILHSETKEMEARLLILQDKLKESQIETDKTLASTANNSAPKWKSSNTDKGSIRAYGKEVTEKFKKRIVNEGGVIPTVINPPNATRKDSTKNPSPFSENDQQYSPPPMNSSGTTPTITIPTKSLSSVTSSENFSTKPADTWTVDDVADWLRMIKLDQYVDIFQANQISGTVLLEFTLEDLDYLQITILGHRKTLLRAINELKQSNPTGSSSSLNTPSLASGSKTSGNNTVVTSGLQRSQSSTRMAEGEKALLSKSLEVKKPVHWSQIEPISNNKVKGDGQLPINAADKPHSDIFDEEAERQAFMEAVAEWRRGDGGGEKKGNITIVREYQGGKTSILKPSSNISKPSAAEAGMWNNPFSAASPPESKEPSSLLSGQLDEEQEHAEFVKAVEAWRGSKRSSNNNNNNEAPTPRGVAVGEISTSPNDKTKLLAENLAKQLEREQREFLEKIEKQKQEAEKRLYLANLELEKIRRNKIIQSANATSFETSSNAPNSHSSSASSIVIDSQAKSHDFEEIRASASPQKSAKDAQQRVYTYVKEPVAKDSSYNDSDDEGGNSLRIRTENSKMTSDRPSSVKIALVESILTSPLDNDRSEGKFSPREEEEGFCVIEYESD